MSKLPSEFKMCTLLDGKTPLLNSNLLSDRIPEEAKLFALELEEILSNNTEVSDMDCDYYATGFEFIKKPLDSLVQHFKITAADDILIKDVTKNKVIFWDDDEFDKEHNPIDDYFDKDEIKAYKTASKLLQKNCKKVFVIKFPYEYYVGCPVFFVGIKDSKTMVGIATVRIDT